MRYAIISDIHGNLEALKAVKRDIENQNIDRIICLGDVISKGSHGHECVQIIKEMCNAVVKGNNDIHFTKSLDEIAGDCKDFDYDYFYWNQKQLSSEDILYIRNLPMCCEFMLSGRRVRCFHASPTSTTQSVFNFSPYEEKFTLFKPSIYTTNNLADVVVYGHTHNACYEKLYGRILVNCGSVGNALNLVLDETKNAPNISQFTTAEYVILSGEDGTKNGKIGVEFRCVEYDKEKELVDIPNKYKKVYETEIMNGIYRHPERLNIDKKQQ